MVLIAMKIVIILLLELAVVRCYLTPTRMQKSASTANSRLFNEEQSNNVDSLPSFQSRSVLDGKFKDALKHLEKGKGSEIINSIDDEEQKEEEEEQEEEEEFFDEDFAELYADSLQFEIDSELLQQLKDRDILMESNPIVSQGQINQEKITQAIHKWRKHDTDVGSAAVQVAIYHERVLYLTQHMLRHRKDNAAKRGLQQLVVERRKMLDYLYKTDRATAQQLITTLGIRYRAPGRFWDKQIKYGRFKNTKQKQQKSAPAKRPHHIGTGQHARDTQPIESFSRSSVAAAGDNITEVQ